MSFFALILPLCAILTSGCSREQQGEEQQGGGGRKQAEMFPVGSYVAAVYDGDWYVAQVEGEEPEEETEGYTL
jgi:hypothetical protein